MMNWQRTWHALCAFVLGQGAAWTLKCTSKAEVTEHWCSACQQRFHVAGDTESFECELRDHVLVNCRKMQQNIMLPMSMQFDIRKLMDVPLGNDVEPKMQYLAEVCSFHARSKGPVVHGVKGLKLCTGIPVSVNMKLYTTLIAEKPVFTPDQSSLREGPDDPEPTQVPTTRAMRR